MKFPYIAYGDASGAGQPAVVHRPVVPVLFRGPRGTIRRFGLVDTGSDISLALNWVADVIGASLLQSPSELVAGVDGRPMETRIAVVELELRQGNRSLRFASQIHFGAQDFLLLGTEGFLEYFTATFDWADKTIELLPNQRIGSA